MKQELLIERARAVLPAGGLGNLDPGIVIQRGEGARVWDEDGNEYIDYLLGSGPMFLGHGHAEVVEAVQEQIGQGTTFFASNARAIELAEAITEAVACAEQVRYVSTGTEADMYAMRLARAFTGRDKIVKFEGGYHGMSSDAQMSLAPAELANFPVAVPDSAGIPDPVRQDMLIAPYNDPDFARSLIAEHAADIAGIIVEPLQRIIPPQPGFLETLREECSRHGIPLIFDEVVTGFRFAYGGAQEAYGVVPDICTLGKIIGGGFPLAAVAASAEIMAHFDKEKAGGKGFLMQVGTLSGNPVAAVAGLKTLEVLRRPGAYQKVRAIGEELMQGIGEALSKAGHAHRLIGHPTMFEAVFTDRDVVNYRDVLQCDSKKAAAFHDLLRQGGIFKAPGKTYVSLALTERDVAETLEVFKKAAEQLA